MKLIVEIVERHRRDIIVTVPANATHVKAIPLMENGIQAGMAVRFYMVEDGDDGTAV